MVGWFALNVPSGLSLYYFSNTLITSGIQIWLRKLGGEGGVLKMHSSLHKTFIQDLRLSTLAHNACLLYEELLESCVCGSLRIYVHCARQCLDMQRGISGGMGLHAQAQRPLSGSRRSG
jgi:hypothetical protein